MSPEQETTDYAPISLETLTHVELMTRWSNLRCELAFGCPDRAETRRLYVAATSELSRRRRQPTTPEQP